MVELFLAMPGIVLLPVPLDLVTSWIALLRQHPVTRGEVFDLQFIAVMLGNDVKSVYSFNISDFARFTQIIHSASAKSTYLIVYRNVAEERV